MNKQKFLLCIGLLVCWSFSLKGFNLDSIQQVVNTHLGEYNGVLVCAQDDSIYTRFSNNFGFQVDENSLFQVADISTVLLYQLYQEAFKENRFKEQDYVKTYLVDFPYDSLRIGHLLQHTSGLRLNYVKLFHRNYYNNPNNRLEGENYRFDNYDIYPLLVKYPQTLTFQAGKHVEYNPLNYLILTVLLEKSTLLPLQVHLNDWLKKEKLNGNFVVVHETDTFYHKQLGAQFVGGTLRQGDNIQHLGFPYQDGTYGHQHVFLNAQALKNLGLWMQKHLFNETNPQDFKSGFNKITPDLYYVYGAFCGHQSLIVIGSDSFFAWMSNASKQQVVLENLLNTLKND